VAEVPLSALVRGVPVAAVGVQGIYVGAGGERDDVIVGLNAISFSL
jgi:hypothetical protein